MCSAATGQDKDGKSADPAAGVAIMLSDRMVDKVIDEGHIGTRIVWVKLAGPVCNIFFIIVYMCRTKEGHRHLSQATQSLS